MDYFLLILGVVLAFPAYIALAHHEGKKGPIFRSLPLRFLTWFIASLLWIIALLALIPVGLGWIEARRILGFCLQPLFILGLIIIATGMALGTFIHGQRAKPDQRTLSGKETLGIAAYFVLLYVLTMHRAYTREHIGLFTLLSVAGAIVVSFVVLPLGKRVRAAWRQPCLINWRPLLYVVPLILAGAHLAVFSMRRYAERRATGYSDIHAHPSGLVAMEAHVGDNTGSFVCDHLGREFTALPGDVELWGRVGWPRDARHLYLWRPRSPDGKKSGSGLWRLTLRGQDLKFLRPMPHSHFRVSPDGRKLIFVREAPKKEEEAEAKRLTQLVCGDSENAENDRVICEGRVARQWPSFCYWHPSSEKVYLVAYGSTSLGEQAGLWSVDCSWDESGEPAFILPAKEIWRVACNPSGSHLAVVSCLREGEAMKHTVQIVELATSAVREIPVDSPICAHPSQESLAWDTDGVRLTFGDHRGIKVYDLATDEVRLVVRGRPTPEGPFYYEHLEPVTWLPDGKLLFYCWFSALRTYDPASGETEDSPLNKCIAKWVKRHGYEVE